MHNMRMQWHFCKVCADSFDLLLDGANKAVPCVQLQVLLQVVESHRAARAIFLEFNGCPPALVAVNEERLLRRVAVQLKAALQTLKLFNRIGSNPAQLGVQVGIDRRHIVNREDNIHNIDVN